MNTSIKILSIAVLAAACAAPRGALAADSKTEAKYPGFVYAVRLVDSAGNPLPEGPLPCTVQLFGVANGGRHVVSNDLEGVVVGTNGAFSVRIGENNDTFRGRLIQLAKDAKTAPYLQLSFKHGGKTYTLPTRQKIGQAARATVANEVSGVSGDFLAQDSVTLTGNLVVNGGADFGKNTRAVSLDVKDTVVISNGFIHAGGPLSVGGTFSTTKELTAKGTTSTNVFPSASIGGTFSASSMAVTNTATIGGFDIAFPKGAIVMWSGKMADIPKDWALCDGVGGRPDLRHRFVLGAAEGNADGKNDSGTNSVVLTSAHLPPHQHGNSIRKFAWFGYLGYNAYDYKIDFLRPCGDPSKANAKDITTSSKSSTAAHENRPPFHALYYIIKVR